MKHSLWKSLIITKIVFCLCIIIPLQGMLPRATSNMASTRSAASLARYQRTAAAPIKATSLPNYQKAATHNFLTQRTPMPQQRASIGQQFTPHQTVTSVKNQKFSFEKPPVSQKKPNGSWLATLGLGWLWYNSEDKQQPEVEQISEQESPQQETIEKDITLDDLVKKFAPPKEIQETIETHKGALSQAHYLPKPYLIEGTNPPIYHKRNQIDRVINAELLREVIKENNLDIEIPKKYIYPNPNNGKYEVFVQGVSVKPIGNESLTLKEIKALMTLVTESCYTDFNKDNVFRNPYNNKLVIVDTENDSFFRYSLNPPPFNEYSFKVKPGDGYPRILCVEKAINKLNREFKVSLDAQDWADYYFKKLEHSKQAQEKVNLYTSRYNKLNISGEKAIELQREIQKQNDAQETFGTKAP